MPQTTLRIARKNRGFTPEYVAEYCNISVNALCKFENEPGLTPVLIVIKLRILYNIPLDFIEVDTDDPEELSYINVDFA